MRTLIAFFALILLFFASFRAEAQTAVPNTGLGCPDFLISGSTTLTNQIIAHQNEWHFVWDTASYTSYGPTTIHVQNYDCNSFDVAGLYSRVASIAHEVGHVLHPWVIDVPQIPFISREVFIENSCAGEGRAVINNIVARNEIYAFSNQSADIGYAAANGPELVALYNAGKTDVEIGKAFCDANVTSTTGQNYNDYYGQIYDNLTAP
ncbi:hypothetical protein [Pseudoxanthomonas sp. USHLN014]|uniref:hypothetical protein n=1 Tax=Pseudoxanthomonas sp. USHLN014 TaxID=3081297 RepID=UPI00301C528B